MSNSGTKFQCKLQYRLGGIVVVVVIIAFRVVVALYNVDLIIRITVQLEFIFVYQVRVTCVFC